MAVALETAEGFLQEHNISTSVQDSKVESSLFLNASPRHSHDEPRLFAAEYLDEPKIMASGEVVLGSPPQAPVLSVYSTELDGEISSCIDAESRDILMYLPVGVDRSNITLCPGGLPLDIWHHVIDNIDDIKTWEAFGLTCKVLASRIIQISREANQLLWRDCASPDLRELHNQLVHTPLAGHLLHSLRIPAVSMTKLFYEFSGKLYKIQNIHIQGDGDSFGPVLPPLRLPLLMAVSAFQSVTEVNFSGVVFWSTADFGRFISAFKNLKYLSCEDISLKRATMCNVVDQPFAKHLCLRSVDIIEPDDLSKYKFLLVSQRLFRYMTYLTIMETDVTGGARCTLHVSQTDASNEASRDDSLVSENTSSSALVSIKWYFRGCEWVRTLLELLDDVFVHTAPSTFGQICVHLTPDRGTERSFTFLDAGPPMFAGFRVKPPCPLTIMKSFYKDNHFTQIREVINPP
ncbi:hypothetical protein CERSUDRAFT_100727 [Gelatoporia subvermispora B]|uniref:Uncharacterized protein n=1 Tax=Ceriporiopsis subvermispora (strain B) TaxID=914234 RepID=M2QX34_CERS8|nr:hypothetical protein CERSUDRAFT_100727 [Gelatoporia subvermispora B]